MSAADASGSERVRDERVHDIWIQMSDLVLDNVRRRAVADALDMSFGLTRALRRLARRSMSMRELADAMDIDPPNATAVVDKLERRGLVERTPHPTDRRAKIVAVTDEGRRLAQRANDILAEPPAGLLALAPDDLATLERLLAAVATASTDPPPPA